MVKRRKKYKWVGQLFWSLIGASLVGYFLYHTVQGDRGWFAMLRVQNEIKIGEANLARLQKEREELEHRTLLLRDKSMDPDLLDEKARELLNYSKPNEIIVLTPKDKSPDSPKAP